MVASLYGAKEEKKNIWVFLEHHDGVLAKVSIELLSKGRQLADEVQWPLVGLLIGHELEELVEESVRYPVDEIWMADHKLLETFDVETHTTAAAQLVAQEKPSVILFGATPDGRDLAGRLAVRLKTGLNADCTDLRMNPENGVLVSEVTGFGGGVLALLEMPDHRPQMATVRPGVFTLGEAKPSSSVNIKKFLVKLNEGVRRTSIVEQVRGEGVDLTQAEVLVCGGRGISGNFKMLEELAQLLNGEVGATRPPVDEGHIERERQIGQTGVICRPKVAIVCGISGAFHFVVGIQDADIVISVNSDPAAPIFEFSDYCIVGDASEIIPSLTHALALEGESAYA
ncbi:MAG: electron transfer flavoprotein subunit alpha [Anaerolineales bacterium]|nr:electron transfer flavoprotein subunit alpha [Anaerolineales bacterium]